MNNGLLEKLAKLAEKSSIIDEKLYTKYEVKRGLRNKDFTGVLVGLTKIGDVQGYSIEDGKVVPAEGVLRYSGFDLRDIVEGFQKEDRPGFDECAFILLFGRLPSKSELKSFSTHLEEMRDLPEHFTQDMILKHSGIDIMNMLARCVLALYTLDENAEDTSTLNVIQQSLNLIAKFPAIIAYSYHSMRHKYHRKPLVIRHPKEGLHTAENFLYMLKGKTKYTELEAKVLDLLMVLHAEHGGGNNSTFSTHVVSSSGTDTYSAVAAALGSLKGPLHGGANIKVMYMMDDIKKKVKKWDDENELSEYIRKLIKKEAFDKSGKIYGFGHAVYTLSDPREVLLREKARELANEKGKEDEFELYRLMAELVPKVFKQHKESSKLIAPNVDFFSGFVYGCIGVPKELCTSMFAMARIVGWCAHRMEELISSKRIIRPAYKSVAEASKYILFKDRSD